MRSTVILAAEIVAVFGAAVLSFKLSPSYSREVIVGGFVELSIVPIALGLSGCVGGALYIINGVGSYDRVGRVELAVRGLVGCVIGTGLFAAIYAIFTNAFFGRYVIGIFLLTAWIATTCVRCFIESVSPPRRLSVCLIGSEDEVRHLKEIFGGGFATVEVSALSSNYIHLSTSVSREREASENPDVAYNIVVGSGVKLSTTDTAGLMQRSFQGTRVIDLGSFCEMYLRFVYVPGLNERWFWENDPRFLHAGFRLVKRGFDIVVSSLGLCLSLPVGLCIVAALKLQDRGPVFYSQIRMGYLGRPFRIYKFRTMAIDAERGGAQWASKRDARVTFLGRFLRATRLDELPQFYNILRGDMSFVGPRPERPEMVEIIEKEVPFFRYRTLLKPGLSGWAQVNYPYGASIEDARRKLSYDLYYIKHASIFLDLVITLRTVIAMVKGAR